MGRAGGIVVSVLLATWQCRALRTVSELFGETFSEPVDNWHGWSLSGAQNIAYVDDDANFFADQGTPRTQDALTVGNETELPYMWGRLGDALNQLLWYILWAERSNFTAVHVLDKGFKKVEGFLDIPRDSQGRRTIWIDSKSQSAVDPGGNCTRFEAPGGSFVSCSSDARSRRRVMIQYIKPLLVPLARADMRSRGNGSDELVIHIRSGDAWSKVSFKGSPLFEYNMPPCAFYDKIIETGNKGGAFQHVRIITEADHANPCVDLIRKRHPSRNVLVQARSREEDAAAIMNARHLATSQSHFSWILAEMNSQLETLFLTHAVPGFYEGVSPCGLPGDPRVVRVTIPGLEVVRSPPPKKREWMVGYPEGDLSLAEC